jgi:DNA-binding NarL/FixJ family response regulator
MMYLWGSKLKKSFDGSDVILTTLAKFRLQKKMASHNKEITTETKQMILRLKREGYVHRKIAEIIGRDHSTCHDQQLPVFHLRILHVSNIIELTWQAYLCTNLHDFSVFQ